MDNMNLLQGTSFGHIVHAHNDRGATACDFSLHTGEIEKLLDRGYLV